MQRTLFLITRASKKRTIWVRGIVRTLAALSPLALSGCSGIQSTLAPHGPDARVIADISWIMFWGAAAILTCVMVLALYAMYRAPDKRRPVSANALIIAGGVVFPVVTLTALLIYGVHAMAGLRTEQSEHPIQLDVTGNQWWWDIRYQDDASGAAIVTANEIHIPVGVPVAISLRSNDVIHSLWVPNLAGKIDLIPGRTNRIVLQADKPGTYRGQCAEYCGAQHARMAFLVIAEPADAYRAWLERQRAPAVPIADQAVQRGQDAFRANNCIACHTVRGHSTASGAGPDLTHLGARRTLLAGTIENTPANLIAVITRSQQIKPGNRMPSHPQLDEGTQQALAAYLESLH